MNTSKKFSFNGLRLTVALIWVFYSLILFLSTPYPIFDVLTFVLCYVFVTLAFGFIIFLTFYRAIKGELGLAFPITLVSFGYAALQVLISIILLLIVNIGQVKIPLIAHVWIQLPLLLIFVISFIFFNTFAGTINKNLAYQEKAAVNNKTISLRIDKTHAFKRSVKVRDLIDSLALAIRFMDLNLNPQLQDVEQDIISGIDQLNYDLANSEVSDEDIINEIKAIQSNVQLRNKLSSMYRR